MVWLALLMCDVPFHLNTDSTFFNKKNFLLILEKGKGIIEWLPPSSPLLGIEPTILAFALD